MRTAASTCPSSLAASATVPSAGTQGEVVYTYVGDIIVSVNPFTNVGCVGKQIRSKVSCPPHPKRPRCPPLWGLITARRARASSQYHKGNRQQQPPHIYALVDSTFAQMLDEQHSQSILISGESGAGKTEAMKVCLTCARAKPPRPLPGVTRSFFLAATCCRPWPWLYARSPPGRSFRPRFDVWWPGTLASSQRCYRRARRRSQAMTMWR